MCNSEEIINHHLPKSYIDDLEDILIDETDDDIIQPFDDDDDDFLIIDE